MGVKQIRLRRQAHPLVALLTSAFLSPNKWMEVPAAAAETAAETAVLLQQRPARPFVPAILVPRPGPEEEEEEEAILVNSCR